jgi:hypothetical protein
MGTTPTRTPAHPVTPRLPAPELSAPPRIANAARVAGWGLTFWGGTQLAASLLERRPMALSLLQAALAEWGAGRMAIPWSDPRPESSAPSASPGEIGRRVAVGAAMGGAAAIAAIASTVVTGGAAISPIVPSVGALAVGLSTSFLAAVRDELLLRGVVLRATRGLLPVGASLLACGAVAAAARFGVDGTPSMAMATEGLRAVALGAIWTRDRGAWMACAANTAWAWTLGAVVHGGLVDARFAADPDVMATVVGVAALAAIAGLAASASIGRRSLRGGLR